ncbi:MAG: hypothetical protein VYA84_08580 [Planctomycetota bacterium]|nr:hypothetical protein [Planctomycetota bacterium]
MSIPSDEKPFGSFSLEALLIVNVCRLIMSVGESWVVCCFDNRQQASQSFRADFRVVIIVCTVVSLVWGTTQVVPFVFSGMDLASSRKMSVHWFVAMGDQPRFLGHVETKTENEHWRRRGCDCGSR